MTRKAHGYAKIQFRGKVATVNDVNDHLRRPVFNSLRVRDLRDKHSESLPLMKTDAEKEVRTIWKWYMVTVHRILRRHRQDHGSTTDGCVRASSAIAVSHQLFLKFCLWSLLTTKLLIALRGSVN
jgi:hypothetical protein